jgi:DNA-binding CsgD family transcriptional regulator
VTAALAFAPATAPTAAASRPSGAARTPAPGRHSPREVEVLAEMATGSTNAEIGSSLHMSPKTVMHHTTHIYRKLNVRGRAQAVAFAVQLGLIGR